MNERINQLAEQCHHRYSEHNIDLEKFAELIIEDCMAMCDELKEEYFKHRKGTMDFDEKHIYAEGESACFNLRFKMKKHFGVEE